MKVEMINPFITSTLNILSTMANIKAEKSDIYVKSGNTTTYDISGIVGLAGKVSGFMVVSFPEKLALKIATAFLCEEKTEMDDDVVDAIGEIANMIAGSSKAVFAEMGLKYSIGIPSVITGKNHLIKRPSNITYIGINFKIDDDMFSIEVALKETDNN